MVPLLNLARLLPVNSERGRVKHFLPLIGCLLSFQACGLVPTTIRDGEKNIEEGGHGSIVRQKGKKSSFWGSFFQEEATTELLAHEGPEMGSPRGWIRPEAACY